jgi:hypothetical protein
VTTRLGRSSWKFLPDRGRAITSAVQQPAGSRAMEVLHFDSLPDPASKKGGRHVATAAFSLGRKRPRRAYAAQHAAPQQYRRCGLGLQGLSWRNFFLSTINDGGAPRGRDKLPPLHREKSSQVSGLCLTLPVLTAAQPQLGGIAGMRAQHNFRRQAGGFP